MGFVDQVKTMQQPSVTAPGTGGAAAPAPDSTVTPPAASGPTPPTGAPAPASPPSPTGAPPPADRPPAETPPPGAPAPSPAADSAPGSTPPAEGAPPDSAADKRVSDAQRKMHEATTKAAEAAEKLDAAIRENQALKDQLGQLQQDPGLVLEREPEGIPTDEAFDAELAAALEAYQRPKLKDDGTPEKTDAEAFVELERTKADIFDRRLRARQQRARVAESNATKIETARRSIHDSINTFVTKAAPDIPLRLFWSFQHDAERECPQELQGPERLDWQVKRAITLARAELAPRLQGAAAAATQADTIARQSAVVMPGGTGAAPAAPAPAPSAPKSFVEQMKARQASLSVG